MTPEEAQQNLENVVRNLVSTEKTHRTALKDLKEARKAAIQQVIAEEKAHNKLNKAMEQAQRLFYSPDSLNSVDVFKFVIH